MKRKLLSILLTFCLAFSLLPTAALADGETAKVAKVGETEYATLAEAVKNAKTGDTIVMTVDTDISETGLSIASDKDITLDLNGHEVKAANTGAGNIKVYGKLTLRDSTDTSANGEGQGKITTVTKTYIRNQADQPIIYAVNGDFVMQSGLIDTATGITNNSNDGQFGVGVQNGTANASVTINGGKIKAGWYAVAGNGTNKSYSGDITVNGGILESTADYAIYHPQAGTTTINGGVIYGQAGGIQINRGTLVVNNGTVTSKGIGSTGSWGDGTGGTNNAAIHANAEYGDVSVSIKDGKVTAEGNAVTIEQGTAHTATIAISGGTFSSDVSTYCEKNYYTEQNTDNTYTVKSMKDVAVAKIDDTYYKTLADAVAAAKADEATTITLLKDVELPSYIYIKDKKNITLDLNGKNITRTGNGVFYVGNAKLRVTGTGTIFENQRDGFAPIIAKGSPNDVADYTTITIDENVTLKGDYAGIFVDTDTAGKNSYHNYGLVINMKGSIDLTAIDGGVSAYGVYVQGLNKITSGNVMQINLDGVTINTGDEAIYAAGYAKWNVKNCTFNAENAAIEVRAGDMTIDGGVYTAMASEFKCEANGNGSTTQGAALAIMQHTTKLPISVYVKNGVFHSAAAVAEKNIQKNDPKPNVDLQIADGQFNGVVVADDVLNFISGGYFTSDPSAYKAEGKFVVASDKAGYSYMISGTAPTKAEVIVNDKTAVTVPTNENLTNADKTAIQTKTNIDGVAEAVAGSKDAIVKKAGVDASKVDATKLIEVEVAVDVAVSDVQKNAEGTAISTITFTAKPTATVKVDGTEKGTVPVSNDMLNNKPITVKLPLPAGFTPKQILHKFTGGGYEYFINESVGGMRGAGRFKIEDNCAVFTIYGFSTFELSGTVTYVEPSYSSGSSYDPTYSVSTPSKTEHGTVTVSPKSASKGDTVTVTVKPDSGYVLETLTVTDKNGNELTLKDKGNGKYTFTMPAGKVEVKATFMEDNSMLNFFYDVPNNAYFYEAVKWAVKNGITTGVGNDLFAPEQPCTRAQIVTFLWRAAGSPEPKGAASGMTDVVSGSYYEKAVAWAIENGITTGTTTTTFSPDATCTRAQAVTFLARALKAKAASAAEFSDVPTGSYFADAVAWAAANGVTEGIGGGLFGSDNDCTRGQIVTFLYRAYNK